MRYVLGLGSNLGPSLETFRRALPELSRHGLRVLRLSPLYESEAMLPRDLIAPQWRRPFLNAALIVESWLTPPELLRVIKIAEENLGRQSRERWAPREIDIDILLWEKGVYRDPELTIPHEGLRERPFALLPLTDLLPNERDPADGQTYFDLTRGWRSSSIERVPYQTRRSRQVWTELVGVLNLTPDSFSDGGMWLDPERALERAEGLVKEGATVLDLGAESTRPGARAVTPEVEWERLAPALHGVRKYRQDSGARFQISVDTRHPETADRALSAGCDWINDVNGLQDPRMIDILRGSDCRIIAMHSLTVPVDPKITLKESEDPVTEVRSWIDEMLGLVEDMGIDRGRLILDPGIGFGKTVPQNWELLRRTACFHDYGLPLYVGHSRKSFLSAITQIPFAERDLETATLSTELASQGVAYLRVHNVEANARALAAWSWLGGCARFTDGDYIPTARPKSPKN